MMNNVDSNAPDKKLWGGYGTYLWFGALSLPTYSWAKPFLALTDCPQVLLEDSSTWAKIYEQAVAEHNTLIDRETMPPLDRLCKATRQVVIKALQQLARQMGMEVAVDFERWIRCHFFQPDIHNALRRWRYVLGSGCNPSQRKIPLPEALELIAPQLNELLSPLGKYGKIEENFFQVAPYQLDKYGRKGLTREALLLFQALNTTFTIRALQYIAQNLSSEERQEVAVWAARQLVLIRPSVVEPQQLLGGGKYLQTEPPGADIPSLLEFPQS